MKKRWRAAVSLLRRVEPMRLCVLALAGLINAFGITMFLFPVQLYDSGISGTAMLISQLTPSWCSLSLCLLLLNLPVFLFGFRRQGALFTIYAIFSVGAYALGAWGIAALLPQTLAQGSPFAGKDLLLCACFGGCLSGLGSGLAIRFGGAMDGIEVLAVIFAKRLGLTVGTFVMLYNVLLYVICGIVIHSWTLPLYSIVTYMVALRTVDYVVEGIDRAKAVHIITEKEKEVCAALSAHFAQGITVSEGKGFYSDSPKAIVYIVLNRFQIPRMKDLVHGIDPGAYIAINEVSDVFKRASN